jgi:hypothetical protein
MSALATGMDTCRALEKPWRTRTHSRSHAAPGRPAPALPMDTCSEWESGVDTFAAPASHSDDAPPEVGAWANV